MIDIKDLQIGDWVKVSIVHDHIVKAISIAKNGVYFEHDGYEGFASMDKLSPIPLTTEILEKNGFDVSDPEVKQYHFEEDGQRYHFSLRQMYNQKDGKPNGYSFFAFSVLTIIDYVHQLQHAIRLCQIDKTIEL